MFHEPVVGRQFLVRGIPLTHGMAPSTRCRDNRLKVCAAAYAISLLFAIGIPNARAQALGATDDAVAGTAGTIYINADGSITPPGAPLTTSDKRVYTFTGDITDYIVIARSNMVINGNGHTLQSPAAGFGDANSAGITNYGSSLSVDNVTIENTEIKGFNIGIWVYDDESTGNSDGWRISGNHFTGNYEAIRIQDRNNEVTRNSIIDNILGVVILDGADSCTVSANNITTSLAWHLGGISIISSRFTTVSDNFVKSQAACIRVEAGSHNTTITGNTVEGLGPILLYSSHNNTINSNSLLKYADVTGGSAAIRLDDSSNDTVAHNSILTNNDGIYARSVNNSTLSGNYVNHLQWPWGYDIELASSLSNRIVGNMLTSTNFGGGAALVLDSGSMFNLVDGNTISDCSTWGMQIQGSYNRLTGNTITNSSGGEIRGSHNTLSGNGVTMRDRCYGFLIHFGATDNDLTGNHVNARTPGIASPQTFGIALWESASGNTIRENNIGGCRWGLSIQSSATNNQIVGNNVTGNQVGVEIQYAFGNTIYGNDFVGNAQQVQQNPTDSSMNAWDAGYPIGGNYWSDYTGNDTMKGPAPNVKGADGMGDSPYATGMVGGNKDSYPLMTVLFNQTGVGPGSAGPILVIDGAPVAVLPVSFMWSPTSVHSFAFRSPLPGTPNATRYVWANTTGLSTSQDESSLAVPVHATISANYITQFQVTFDQVGLDVNATGVVLTIGGSTATSGDMPFTEWFDRGTSYSYAATARSSDPGMRFSLDGIAGLASPISSPGTVRANYSTQFRLTVSSAHGQPAPRVGDSWYNSGTFIPASVTSPAQGPGGTRYKCSGWTGTGNVTVSGNATSTGFTMAQTSTITWNWAPQYLLTVLTDPTDLGPQPMVSPPGEPESSNSWWYDPPTGVALAGQTIPDYNFSYWDIDGVAQGSGVNPVSINTTAPLAATAHYVSQTVDELRCLGVAATMQAVAAAGCVIPRRKRSGRMPGGRKKTQSPTPRW